MYLIDDFKTLKKIKLDGFSCKINISEKFYETTILELFNTSIDSLHFFPNIFTLIFKHQKKDIEYLFSNLTLKKLQFLDISNNFLKNISFLKALNKSKRIEYLDFSNNPLSSLDHLISNFKFLKILRISNLRLFSLIELDGYLTPLIEEIYLNNTNIAMKRKALSVFKNLDKIQKFFGDSFRICCILWKFYGEQVICRPSSNVFSSCSNIIGSRIAKILFWFSGLFATIGNILNFILSFLTIKDSTILYRQILAFSDFLTGFYMLSIIYLDQKYSNSISVEQENWSNNIYCQILGSILTFSLLFSSINLCMLSLERYFAVCHPFKIQGYKKLMHVLIILLMILSIVLSFLPIIFYKVIFSSVFQIYKKSGKEIFYMSN